jgi:hypothetical protein
MLMDGQDTISFVKRAMVVIILIKRGHKDENMTLKPE